MTAPAALRVNGEDLRDFIAQVFANSGFAQADAETIAEVLTWANLRGIDSHGVLRAPMYLRFVKTGRLNPAAKPHVILDLPAAVVIDAERGAGAPSMVMATDHAMAKARLAGIGLAQVRRTTHTGPIGYYALRAADSGMAAIVMSASTPNMAYIGARLAGVSNSPIAIAVPSAGRPPILLDMAASVAASGKLSQAEDSGLPIPTGWALTEDGQATTDPAKADVLLPLGGAKGSGLALMVECLTSMMIGNPILEPILTANVPRGHGQNAMVIAFNIAAFTPLGDFTQSSSALATALKALPKADGVTNILMPGERSATCEAERRRDGIPLAPGTWKKMVAMAQDSGVALPRSFN